MRGNHVITDVKERSWRISTVALADKANYSCTALNAAGRSAVAQVALDVLSEWGGGALGWYSTCCARERGGD